MSKITNGLAVELDNIVDNFMRKAQMEPLAEADPSNSFPQGAVKAVVNDSAQETLSKWNDIINKLSDAEYELSNTINGIDVRVAATYSGGKYTSVKVMLEFDPNYMQAPPGSLKRTLANKLMMFYTPHMNAMGAKALMAANRSRKPGNSSFGLYLPGHVRF